MFLRLLIVLTHLFFIPCAFASYKYDLSVCMIFRDEAPYLKEWIEFHRLLGVEHFYLYNNLSQDNYKDVLNPYINSGIVELIEWNQEAHDVREWDDVQIGAYNDGLIRAKKASKWLAILDSDEFLFPTTENSLPKFLKKYEKIPGFGGLLVNWVVFGTSWVPKIPDDKLLIETLVWCSPTGSDNFKSVFLTKRAVHVCSPHYVIYKKGYHHTTPNGSRYPSIEVDKIRINHYWSRDEWYLNNIKIPRRSLWGTDPATCKYWAEAGNGAKGMEILRFVNALRYRMQLR